MSPDEPPSNGIESDGGEISAAELTERLLRIAHLIRRASLASMAELDLTPAQSRTLRVISKADSPIRMGELAATLGVVPRSATGLVDALEHAGLVERTVDTGPPVAVSYALTDNGQAVLPALQALTTWAQENLTAERCTGGAPS